VRSSRLAAALGVAFAVATAAPAQARDYARPALDIIPSGQYGAVPQPPGALTQAKMYDALTPLFNRVSDSQLHRFFKPMTLGTATPGPARVEEVPRRGVRIVRDGYGVPHIFGKTRDDVTWGAGWVMAEDRGLLLEQARYDSLVAAIDAPGLSALDLVSRLQSFKPSAQTIQEVDKQTNALLAAGRRGYAVLHDIDVYLEGINAYLRSIGSTDAPFTRTDVYAFNALKSQFVGQGGGDEAVRSEFLSALQHRLGSPRGWDVFNDLRELDDPETPVSVPGRVQFQPPPRSTSGNVILDSGSVSPAAVQALDVARDGRGYASNALLVAGWRSANHHPIMVAGPQIGYFYPGLTLEMDLEGPGISQRGATAAPFPGYIFIGRSQDAAWSLTSAGLDLIDTYVETLCGHSIHRYLFDGQCRAMQFFDAGSLNGEEVTFYRTVHGPVIGYARVQGRQVALSRKRASYGRDVTDLLFYHDLAHGQVHNIHQFFKAACLTPQTFNSLYIDDKDIGVFTSGLIPIRPPNVDQGLPVDGRGKEEWHGDVPCRNHPQGIDPPSGQVVNWNNRTQAGYQAPDDNWSLGAVQRVDLLLNNLGKGGHLTPARVVAAMNAAATQDVREMTFEPVLSKLLRTGRAPSPRAAKMLALLDAWRRHGGSRLDRTGNGEITDPGAAIMDTAWPLLANAWASLVLGPTLTAQFASFTSQFEQPPAGQKTGWHIYMQKDLRTLLGEHVRGKFAVRYCGAGRLSRCRAELWAAIDQAGNDLAAEQGPNPAAWRASATDERITFVPGLLKTSPTSSIPFSMRYTNRPSGIQQVVSFIGHSPQDTGRGPKPKPPPPPPIGLG
jgi:acyl-homoserine lactone acylase PvdQ